jgi:hypothetical protein
MSRRFIDFYKILLILSGIGLFSFAVSVFTGRSVCVIYSVTGIPCPSCGMTRACFSLLNGDFAASFHYHPLLIVVFFFPVIFLLKGLGEKRKNILFLLIGAVFGVVWVIRFSLYFPHTAPFEFNKDALIPAVVDYLKHV